MSKTINIEGMPSIVEVQYHNKKYTTAEINLERRYLGNNPDVTTKSLSEALAKLLELGFVFTGTTYTLGYYDSVENITMEFSHNNFKTS